MYFVLASPGSSSGGGLLCGYLLGVAVFFEGKAKSRAIHEQDVAMFRTSEHADMARMAFLDTARRDHSPSLELLQNMVVVMADDLTDLNELADYWHKHTRFFLSQAAESCRARI